MKIALAPLIALFAAGSVFAQSHPISVRTFERDGIGETGTFDADERRADSPKGPPVLSSTRQTSTYKHYDVDLTNRAKVGAEGLRMDYVIYTISGDGKLISNADSAPLERMEPGKRATVKTRGAALIRTTTTTTTVSVRNSQLNTGSKTDRAKERFGGIWVRVYTKDDKLVGEGRDLTAEVERAKPAWKAPKKDGGPSIEEGIVLPEITIKPPAPPTGSKTSPELPKPPKPPF